MTDERYLIERADRAGELLEAAALDGNSMRHAFPSVARTLGFEMFQLFHFTRPDAPDLVVAPGLEDLREDYAKGWHEIDTWSHGVMPLAKPGVLLTTGVIPKAVRDRDAFFQEFCPKWGTGQFASRAFDMDGEKWAFTFMRKAKYDISAAEHAMLKRFMPFADRAALLARRTRDARARGLADGLELGGRPAIVLNHSGQVMFSTTSVAALLGQGFTIHRGYLRGLERRSDHAFMQLAEQARLSNPAMLGNFLIRRQDGRRGIVAMPTSLRDRDLDALPGARLIVMLVDLDAESSTSGRELQAMFSLTPAEADIALLLGKGLSTLEISDVRGVTRDTVRSQIKALFRKMEASRQSDIVRLIERMGRSGEPGNR